MKILNFILVLVLLAACKSALSPEEKAVEAATAYYKDHPSDSSGMAVIAAMGKYIELKGYADSTSARYVLESARISADLNQLRPSLSYYKTYLMQYPDRPDQADKLVEFIKLAERLDQPELDDILYKSFGNRFPQDERTATMSSKIQQKEIAADSILRFIGMHMFNDSTFRLNEERANLYIDACEAAVAADPNFPNAPEYLFHAAETSSTLRNIPRAINLYDWILQKYPTNKRASTSLFLKGFTYDNELKDFEKAGKYYHEFLEKYPNDEYAASAKFLLDNLGKSEEELKNMLEQKSKENVQ
jgi:TolA-binding protein